MMPTRGSTSRIQPSAIDSVGRKKLNQNMNSSPRAHGMFVRASNHAMKMATGNEIPCWTAEMLMVFQKAEATPGVEKAATQASRAYLGGWPMRATLKLLMNNRATG